MSSTQGPRAKTEANHKTTKISTDKDARTEHKVKKKRTKTGCLTCRRRRIKCGEERPICSNCQRSRRVCEGYKPPLVIKPSHINIGQGGIPLAPFPGSWQYGIASGVPYGYLPNGLALMTAEGLPENFSAIVQNEGHDGWGDISYQSNVPLQHSSADTNSPLLDGHLQGQQWQTPITSPENQYWNGGFDLQPNLSEPEAPEVEAIQGPMDHSMVMSNMQQAALSMSANNPLLDHTGIASASAWNTAQAEIAQVLQEYGQIKPNPLGSLDAGTVPDSWEDTASGIYPGNKAREYPQAPGSYLGPPDASQILNQAAIDIQDDDYWDVQDSEEENLEVQKPSLFDNETVERDYRAIIGMTRNSLSLAITNYVHAEADTYPGFSLDFYRPEYTANPLRNPFTQRVFAHFIFSTGPMISYLQQRNRITSFGSAASGKIAASHQGLWTYSLAMMALHNQGLLHAMLAMASLHLAKLQGASETPSLKHYSFSLRRVHKDVRKDRQRHEVTTLAATLLLAFYEIATADHRKWSTHVVGAKQLVSEIDFRGLTAQIKHEKAKWIAKGQEEAENGILDGPCKRRAITMAELFPDVDRGLLNQFMGRQSTLDSQGRVVEDIYPPSSVANMSDADLRNYQILQDLFWWNCRHEIIYGLVGGNSLLLEYEEWDCCAPRAPLGKPDAVFGSFDHFMLIMGRLVRYICRDRPRKIKANAQKGPGFYGLAPSFKSGEMPQAYRTTQETSPYPGSPEFENAELGEARDMALAEWNDIWNSFTALASNLGPNFAPLADEEHRPIDTPFGPAVVFRSYGIAALWAWYYAGLIIAQRSHPDMPAAATVQVGSAAPYTAKYANQVGRITYAISSDFLTPPLDPSSAGAFAESSLPLFFAGVQFREDAQRKWTVGRLREIEALTGWATMGLCANGCENSWVRAHEMGVGPKYEKSTGIEQGSERVSALGEEGGTANVSQAGDAQSPSNNTSPEARLANAERKFSPFYRGRETMWAFQLYSADLRHEQG